MEKIPETFKLNGFEYKLVKREKDTVLYEQWKKSETSGLVKVFGWEVHKVRKMAVVSRTRKHFKEILARDDFKDSKGNWVCEFGEFGWSYQHLVNAETKFKELVQNG